MPQRTAVCRTPTRRGLALTLTVLMVAGLTSLGAFAPRAGATGTVSSFTNLDGADLPLWITTGPDGALWFSFDNAIGRITTAGTVTVYPVGPPLLTPWGSGQITTGPDGALWFTAEDAIGRITTGGTVTTYSTGGLFAPGGIVPGPDGALWFTFENGIGRITTSGTITTYPVGVPMLGPFGSQGITSGSDGALWFAAANAIGRITTSGIVTTISDPSINSPNGIATGPDGAVWFTNLFGNSIGRIAVAAAGAVVVPTVASRVAGGDPITSAVAVSQSQFPTAGTAHGVVLARADDPADALAGVPLAVKVGGPILLTPTDTLDAQTAAEINRVLPKGGTVYLVGGPSALSDTVESAVSALGDVPVRLGGLTRAATAVDIAEHGLGNPTVIFEVDGFATQDAISAGIAAAVTGGSVVFTEGGALPTESAAYLAAHTGDTRYGIGAAAGADPAATAINGDSPDATSVLIAQRFFPTAASVGFAGDTDAADAITAGPLMAKMGGPLLFVPLSDGLPDPVRTYLTSVAGRVRASFVFGEPSSISDAQLAAIQGAL